MKTVVFIVIVIALVLGLGIGAAKVLIDEYPRLLPPTIILYTSSFGLGCAGVLGYWLFISPRLQLISRREAALEAREAELERNKEAFEKSQIERAKHIVFTGKMLMLDLTKEELASALGRQIRHVEAVLREEYEALIKYLRSCNDRYCDERDQAVDALDKMRNGGTLSGIPPPKEVSRGSGLKKKEVVTQALL